MQYTLGNVTYKYSDSIPEGQIMDQTPKAGESKKILAGKQKCAVSLVISKGTETVVLEDYTVRDYREADAALRKLGLKCETEQVASEYYTVGYVVKTEPAAGTVLNIGDTVKLYVSQGSQNQMVMVPAFSGLSEAEALVKLIENDLRPGEVTYRQSNQAAGTVIEQSADAYKEIVKYAKIDFVVSGGAYYTGDGTVAPSPYDYTPRETETTEPDTEPEETAPFGFGDDDTGDDSGDGGFPSYFR